MKQTAVEYLADITANIGYVSTDILRQALELEKQQIMDAHNQGYADGYRDNGISPIEYFKETYGK
jgi:hypothetical protein